MPRWSDATSASVISRQSANAALSRQVRSAAIVAATLTDVAAQRVTVGRMSFATLIRPRLRIFRWSGSVPAIAPTPPCAGAVPCFGYLMPRSANTRSMAGTSLGLFSSIASHPSGSSCTIETGRPRSRKRNCSSPSSCSSCDGAASR